MGDLRNLKRDYKKWPILRVVFSYTLCYPLNTSDEEIGFCIPPSERAEGTFHYLAGPDGFRYRLEYHSRGIAHLDF